MGKEATDHNHMGEWIAFWDSPHAIYVNAHHRDVHYRRIAEDIARYEFPGGVILDYGCGDALHAEIAAEDAQRLILCEAAPKLRDALTTRYADKSKIQVVSPEQTAALPEQSLDLIVMHSVAQYLTETDLDGLLALFHRLLKPSGVLVLGDIIPPHVSAVTDAIELLRFGRREGFFVAALLGLLRTVTSDYWVLRTRLGLKRYHKDDFLAKLTTAGYFATRAEKNIGHNQQRMTFNARTSLFGQPA